MSSSDSEIDDSEAVALDAQSASKAVIDVTPRQEPARSPGGIFRALLRREPAADKAEKFQKVIDLLRNHQQSSEAEIRTALEGLYAEWSGKFELLKSEFNKVWELFGSIEEKLPGWYCVSPCLHSWRAVGHVRGGYTFGACLMKNHSRSAPLSHKSLTISFGLDGASPGIGDERSLGRTATMTDSLIGLEACGTAKTMPDRLRAAQHLVERIGRYSLIFRMNHRGIGQQAACLPFSTLKEHSLSELSQSLFVLLNNDIISELKARIAEPEKILLTADTDVIEIEVER